MRETGSLITACECGCEVEVPFWPLSEVVPCPRCGRMWRVAMKAVEAEPTDA